MQVNVRLEYSATDTNKCYVVINDECYIQVSPELWEELAEYFENKSGDLNYRLLRAERRIRTVSK